jgi:hypothetical protein
MKNSFLLSVAVSVLTSCSSIFWMPDARIPAQKVLNTREIEVELFDADGVRCITRQVDFISVEQGGSAVITQFIVPKFASTNRRPTKLNYLWMVDGQDTSVYELNYRNRWAKAIFTSAGMAIMLAAVPVQQVDWYASSWVFFYGLSTSVLGGILIDMPSGIAGMIKESRANGNGLNPRWKLKGVRKLTPGEYPGALVRGIEAMSNEEPADKPSDTLYGKRITQP